MKNKNILMISIMSVVAILLIGGIIYKTKLQDNRVGTANTTDDIDISIDTDNSDKDIIWSDYENREVTLTKSITITEEGVYNLTGTITNGYIKINTKGNVKLVLNNVTITTSSISNTLGSTGMNGGASGGRR